MLIYQYFKRLKRCPFIIVCGSCAYDLAYACDISVFTRIYVQYIGICQAGRQTRQYSLKHLSSIYVIGARRQKETLFHSVAVFGHCVTHAITIQNLMKIYNNSV